MQERRDAANLLARVFGQRLGFAADVDRRSPFAPAAGEARFGQKYPDFHTPSRSQARIFVDEIRETYDPQHLQI